MHRNGIGRAAARTTGKGFAGFIILSFVLPVLIVWYLVKAIAIVLIALIDAGRAYRARKQAAEAQASLNAHRPQAHYSNRR